MTLPRPSGPRAVLSGDTAVAIEQRQIGLWRSMSGSDKLSSAAGASTAVAQLALAGVRDRHPGAAAEEWFLHFARLTLGAPLVQAAYVRWPERMPLAGVSNESSRCRAAGRAGVRRLWRALCSGGLAGQLGQAGSRGPRSMPT
jgi:hypothetical protein